MKMAKLREMLTHRGKNESGQGALAMVLILLMLGAVILTPLLVFMSTGLESGQVYESKMQEFYAADAGVEDGLWQIKYDKLSTLFHNYTPYDYNTSYSYSLAPSTLDYEINAENVTVNITNVWIPDVDALDPDDARDIIENGTLIVTGKVITLDGETGYQITISYYYQADDPDGTSLNVDEIGVWLGTGFHYVPGGLGNLNGYDPSPDIVPHCGGEAIIWDVGSAFKLPGDTDYPLVRTFDFQFTGGQNPQAVSWITTTGVAAVPLSWDADSKPYRIESTAGSTTAEAYVIRNELRKLGAAIPGDYFATGSSLIGYSSTDKYRDRLYQEGEATIATDEYGIDGIPSEATVEAAFLYWTGWIDFHYKYCTWWRHGHCMRWREGEIGALEYPDNPTPENLAVLVEESAKVNNVTFSIGGNITEVTADSWQVSPSTGASSLEGTWSYCCFADVTSLVKGAIEAEEIETNGAATYILSHSSAVINQHRPETDYYYFDFYDSGDATGYPLGSAALGTPASSESDLRDQSAYAGWSLVIIYSSPETKGHQLYLYDIESPGFLFTNTWIREAGIANPDFDGDGEPGGLISGFLVPEPVEGEDIAAKLTVFVGEGDSFIDEDEMWVNNQVMANDESPSDNVWNSESPGLAVPGVDIDTFYIEWDDGIINPADTSAQVDLPARSHGSGSDGFNLVYIILSFRSDITTGGTISYLLRGG
jgi:hypothetical protein